MKSTIIAIATLALTSGAVLAAPGNTYGDRGRGSHGISAYERAVIMRSATNLAHLKRYVWADGRISFADPGGMKQ